MKLQIEATDTVTTIDGVPVRLWKGWTENGIACAVMVHRIAVLHFEDTAEFDAQLAEQLPPGNPLLFHDALTKWREQLPKVDVPTELGTLVEDDEFDDDQEPRDDGGPW